jgi:hypothetical protein
VWPTVEAEKGSAHCECAATLADMIAAAIPEIAKRAARISTDEELLRTWRCDHVRGTRDDNGKSSERRYIWEPAIQLWSDLGHQVGYSENGPVMRIIQIFHEALGIKPPKRDAIRQVIRDFNRERRKLRLVK